MDLAVSVPIVIVDVVIVIVLGALIFVIFVFVLVKILLSGTVASVAVFVVYLAATVVVFINDADIIGVIVVGSVALLTSSLRFL